MTSGQPPRTQIAGWVQAEQNAAAWMRYWGYGDSTVTQAGADGGVDVLSKRAIGQVKFQAAQVGRPELQRLVGARGNNTGKQLFFFTGTSYSEHAVAYADEMGICLFVYSLDGSMTPVNASATREAARTGASNDKLERFVESLARFVARYWRAIIGVWLLAAPFASIGIEEDNPYRGPWYVDGLIFVSLLLASWAAGVALIAWQIKRPNLRKTKPLVNSSRQPASDAPQPPPGFSPIDPHQPAVVEPDEMPPVVRHKFAVKAARDRGDKDEVKLLKQQEKERKAKLGFTELMREASAQAAWDRSQADTRP